MLFIKKLQNSAIVLG